MKCLLDIHTHRIPERENVVAVINQFPLTADVSRPFSVGIHPCFVTENDWQIQWEALQKTVLSPNCVAIGECGLDKNATISWQLQERIFGLHIRLSEEMQKPLIIHCVKAFGEIISFRKKTKPTQIWILHGFRKNMQVAQNMIDNGIKLSFGKALLTDIRLQEIFKNLPDGSFFLETDDAGVSIEEIYQKAASLRDFDFENFKL
ncbi:MAG: TatD family hydrolase [Capnocytophaga sp.]|nr:TatD family hydrolase [Capnocytophaga sp.]